MSKERIARFVCIRTVCVLVDWIIYFWNENILCTFKRARRKKTLFPFHLIPITCTHMYAQHFEIERFRVLFRGWFELNKANNSNSSDNKRKSFITLLFEMWFSTVVFFWTVSNRTPVVISKRKFPAVWKSNSDSFAHLIWSVTALSINDITALTIRQRANGPFRRRTHQ